MPVRSPVFALALAIMLPASVAQGKSKLEFAYVVLGSQGAVARAVYTDATTCPSLALSAQSGKSTQPMIVRALPQSGDASDKKPAFPVAQTPFFGVGNLSRKRQSSPACFQGRTKPWTSPCGNPLLTFKAFWPVPGVSCSDPAIRNCRFLPC